jgi:hypothetical protein
VTILQQGVLVGQKSSAKLIGQSMKAILKETPK